MPTPWQIRKRLIEVCHLAAHKGYVAAYEGNFSARLPGGRVLITPSRVNKGMLSADDLAVIDLAGKPIGRGRPPSSEARLHLAVYAQRGDVMALAHAHPPFATAFAVAAQEMCIDCMPETYVELNKIPLVRYGTPGTHELPEHLRAHLDSGWAYLLQNHGVLCLGEDIDSAYFRLEMVEHAASILHHAAGLGGAKSLCATDVAKLSPHPGRDDEP